MELATKKQLEALSDKFERRYFASDPVLKRKKRDNSEEDDPMICGHASVFNQTADLGYFMESVAPGAFSKTIVEDDVRALFNHDPSLVIGRSGRNLRMSEDQVGLYFEVDMPNTTLGADLQENIRMQLVSQCSIGFYARGVDLSKENGVWKRTLTDIQLFDVSPVTFPAFATTDVSTRCAFTPQRVASLFRTGLESSEPVIEPWMIQFDERSRLLKLAEF